MDIVNIFIDVSDGHLASIYALVVSVITNKFAESLYHIYLSTREEALSKLDALLSLQTDTVRMIPVTEEQSLAPAEEGIRLQWNTIVTGDLTDNDSGILRSDPLYNPEEYFDHPFARQWLKYYKMSPMKDVPLKRRSYIETIGKISIKDTESVVPIAIYTCDMDIPSTVALLYSIRKNTSIHTQLDIRVLYRNLSVKHADELLSFCDENTSIILYNVKRCTDADNPNIRIIPALSVFDEYETLIYMDSTCLCLGDIVSLYHNEEKPYDVCVVGDILNTGEMPKILLLNITSWIQKDICSRYIQLSQKYSSFLELIDLACGERIGYIQSFSMHAFRDGDNPWMDQDEETAQLVWSYLFMSPHFEELKTEAMSYKQQEVSKMQELLKQLKDLEVENNRLSQQVQFLEADNKSLLSERDRFIYELMETRNSFTYRIGRVITFLPRKLRGEKRRQNKKEWS